MASNIFRQLAGEKGIFRNEQALLPEFLPPELPGRERHMRELAFCLMPATEGKAPSSVVLSGVPGTGKTSISKIALKQLCEVSSKPLPIYLNCWEFNTRLGILTEIVSQLGGMLPRRGIASDEVTATLRELGRKTDRIPIVVLDEVDRLIASREEGVLYDLARAQEAFGMRASVIAITNDSELMAKLDPRIRSSLSNRKIDFSPYTPLELKAILADRAKLAFFSGALDEEVVPLCAAVAAKQGGDARIAIALLWASGKHAERDGRMKISVDDVKAEKDKAVGQAGSLLERKKETLDDFDRKLIEAIEKAGEKGADSPLLYKAAGVDSGGERNVRNHLAKLAAAGLIRAEESGEGSGHAKRYYVAGKK